MPTFKPKKFTQKNEAEYQIEIKTKDGTKLLKEVHVGILNARKAKQYFIKRGIVAYVKFKSKNND